MHVHVPVPDGSRVDIGFRHEALVYHGEHEFVVGTTAFIRDGLAAGEPVLVAVPEPKIRLLQTALGADADRVLFTDMERLGHNPARIIPAWREFLDEHHTGDRPARGVGEPAWPGRRPAELVEAQLHEVLLNIAFDGGPGWWLQCPYDGDRLEPALIDGLHGSHPCVVRAGTRQDSPGYVGVQRALSAFRAALPEPDSVADTLIFGPEATGDVRRLVARYAHEAGLDTVRTETLALAAAELATNSVLHGGGGGSLRVWNDGEAVVIEVRDQGHIHRPLVGRELPPVTAEGGRGLWLVNQLCDLVQLRSSPRGTVVRVFTWLR